MNSIRLDHKIIHLLRVVSIPVGRIAIFIVYSWFGALKIFGLSPAGGLVHDLFSATIHVMSFDTFYILFACFEVIIGVMFLIPKLTRFVVPLLMIHMLCTFLPLVLLPGTAWSGFLVLTLEGQYIVKNLVIIALALGIAAHVHPLGQGKTK